MVPCINIVKSIDHQVELTEELVPKVVLLNPPLETLNLYLLVLLGYCLL